MTTWYRAGTVSVTNGSTTVTGSGTQWIENVIVGDEIKLPDGQGYEVADVVSDTEITLATAFLGSNASGADYAVKPTRGVTKKFYDTVQQWLAQTQGVVDGELSGRFDDGTQAEPGVSWKDDVDTGLRRVSAGVQALVANGADKLTVDATGITVDGTINGANVWEVNRVEDFGADDDPATDDATAFQNCIDDLISKGGGAILLGNRRYRLDSTVTVTGNNVWIIGTGPASEMVTYSDITLLRVGSDNPLSATERVQNFGLCQVRLAQFGTDKTSSIGLDVRSASSVWVLNNFISHFYRGIQLGSGATFFLDGNVISSGGRMTADVAGSAGVALVATEVSSSLGFQANDGKYYGGPSSVYMPTAQIRDSFQKPYTEHGILVEASDGFYLGEVHIGAYEKMFSLIGNAQASTINGNTITASLLYLDGYNDTDYGIYVENTNADYNIYDFSIGQLVVDQCNVNGVRIKNTGGRGEFSIGELRARQIDGETVEIIAADDVSIRGGRIRNQLSGATLIDIPGNTVGEVYIGPMELDADGVNYAIRTSNTIARLDVDGAKPINATVAPYNIGHTGDYSITRNRGERSEYETDGRTYIVTIADDEVYSFTPPRTQGSVEVRGGTTASRVIFNTNAPTTSEVWSVGATEATTGELTSSSGGTDGNLVVSAHTDGKVYVRNRRGNTLDVVITEGL